ncbi:2-keto-4-pentenoate hydratase [Zwartia sp.]|uniref:2-keto-4-pentenoate hydratase n=1 Tax=Zwartia sp. TaxID=2978004 RepID=UPI003BAF1821
MNVEKINQAVAQLLPAWKAHARLDGLAPQCRPTSRTEGYQIQYALFEATGEPALGWKIAATSVAGQQHIGVSGPLAGRLSASRCLADNSELSLERNYMCVIEAEFAFLMGRDVGRELAAGVDRQDASLTMAQVMDCVAGLHIAIEVPNSRYVDFVGAGEAQLIADFACACNVVLGPRAPDEWRNTDLSQHAVTVRRNNEIVATGSGANVLGDPRIGLTWLANELLSQGQQLKAGEVVMTGTCVVPVPVAAGDAMTADFGAFGQVHARFRA